MTVMGTFASFALALGLLATVAGVVGIFRMPDFYLRVKPFSVIGTVGGVGIHVGTSLLTPGAYGEKGLITAAVFLVTGPALCQALMLTAHRVKVPSRATRDDLREAETKRD